MRTWGLVLAILVACGAAACGSDSGCPSGPSTTDATSDAANDASGDGRLDALLDQSGKDQGPLTDFAGDLPDDGGQDLALDALQELLGDTDGGDDLTDTGTDDFADVTTGDCGGQTCDSKSTCVNDLCIPLCELATQKFRSLGCSFFALRMDNRNDFNGAENSPDSLLVVNPSPTVPALVQLSYHAQVLGTVYEVEIADPVLVAPLASHSFLLTSDTMAGNSNLRRGGAYRVQSDLPVHAFLYSPQQSNYSNDASMLLPEHALGLDYIIASYTTPTVVPSPSYFNVIAVEDNTTVSWKSDALTDSGGGVPLGMPGSTVQVVMSRGDTMQVAGMTGNDVSGTLVWADKPISVLSGNQLAHVPAGLKFAEHLEEQLIPVEQWGTEYVGATAPKRAQEAYHWRVYSGADNVEVYTKPTIAGLPQTLDKGQWVEIATQEDIVFFGNGPFMPVQYLEGRNEEGFGAGSGDPSMCQAIPTGLYSASYAFQTGVGFDVHYAQVVRPAGGAPILVDGAPIGSFTGVGNYEFSDWPIAEGAHVVLSAQPFGLTVFGYASESSYAFPGSIGPGL